MSNPCFGKGPPQQACDECTEVKRCLALRIPDFWTKQLTEERADLDKRKQARG